MRRNGLLTAGAVAAALAILVGAVSLGQGPAEAAARSPQSGTPVQTAAEAQFQEAIQLELQRNYPAALDAARQAVALDPATAKYVDKQARLAGFLMLDRLAVQDWASVNAFAAELLALEQGWTADPQRLNPATTLRFGQAHFLTGDRGGAEQMLLQAAHVGLLNAEAEVWLYAMYEDQGNAKALKRLANQPWVRFRAFNPVYAAIAE